MVFFSRHWHGLVFAFVVGCIAVAPSLLAPYAIGGNYHGIQFSALDDENIYRARIHEVLDGHFAVSSPFLYEYKESVAVVPPVTDWAFALPSMLLGISAVVVASKFLLPAALFFLVYLLMRRMLGDGPTGLLAALSAALTVTLGADIIDYHYLVSALSGAADARPILWTRLENPVFGGVLLMIVLALLWSVWLRTRPRAYIALGLVLGATVGYFFSFGLALSLVAALCAIALFKKEYRVVSELCTALGISVVVDAWFWYHAVFSVGGEAGRALVERNGMFFTHAPVVNKFLLFATIFVAVNFAVSYVRRNWREWERSWLFLLALLLGSWIAFDQQILTGREIWYQHFAQYTVPLSVMVILASLVLTWRRTYPRLLAAALLVPFFMSIGLGLFTVTSFVPRIPEFANTQTFAGVLAWLNGNAPHDCSVLLYPYQEELDRIVPAYTACNVYDTTYVFFGIPNERIKYNFMIRMRLASVRAADAPSYLAVHQDDVRAYFFKDWNELFASGTDSWLQAQSAALASEYVAFTNRDLETALRRYRIDYIVSNGALPERIVHELPHLKPSTITNGYHIYSF